MSIPTAALSILLLGLGTAIVIRTVAEGGGPLSTGILLGLLFMAAGAGRLWTERGRRR